MEILPKYNWNKIFHKKYSLKYIKQCPLLRGLLMAINIICSVHLVLFGQIYFYLWCGHIEIGFLRWTLLFFSFLTVLTINRLLAMI